MRRHAGEPLIDRLDELGKERTDFQPIVEMQRALRRCLDERDAVAAGMLFKRIDKLVRHVMRMDVDRHALPLAAVKSASPYTIGATCSQSQVARGSRLPRNSC